MKTALIVWLVMSPIASVVIGWLMRGRFGEREPITLDVRDGEPYVGSASVTELALRSGKNEHLQRTATVIGRRTGPRHDA